MRENDEVLLKSFKEAIVAMIGDKRGYLIR